MDSDRRQTRSGKRYGAESPNARDKMRKISDPGPFVSTDVINSSEASDQRNEDHDNSSIALEAAKAMERLRSDLETCENEREAARIQVVKLTEQVEARDINIEALTTDMQQLQLTDKTVKQQLEAAREQVLDQESEIKTLQSQLGEMRTKLTAVENETKRYLDNSQNDTTEVANLKQQVITLTDEIIDLNKKYQSQWEVTQEKQDEITEQNFQNGNLAKRIEELLTKCQDLQTESAHKEEANRVQIEQLQLRIHKMQEENNQIASRITEEKNIQLKEELAAEERRLNAQLIVQSTKANELQQQKLQDLARIHDLEISLRTLKDQMAEIFFYLSINQYKELQNKVNLLIGRVSQKDCDTNRLINDVINMLTQGIVRVRKSQGKGHDWTLYNNSKSVVHDGFDTPHPINHATPKIALIQNNCITPKGRVGFEKMIEKSKLITPEENSEDSENHDEFGLPQDKFTVPKQTKLDFKVEIPEESSKTETVNTVDSEKRPSKYLCKQPEVFKMDKNRSFKSFWTVFKNYAKASNLPKARWLGTLMTFLDGDAIMRLETMGINVDTECTDDLEITKTIDKITHALTNQRDIATAKTRLLRYTQQENQSITEYATILRELSNDAYSAHEKDAVRLEVLKDVFINGLYDEQIQLQVQLARPENFQAALNVALELERSVIQRLGKNRKDDAENVFAVEGPSQATVSHQYQNQLRPNWTQNQGPRQAQMIICYRCRKPGHVRAQCVARIQCGRCGRNNHVTDQCRQLVQRADIRNVPTYSANRQNQTWNNRQNQNFYNRNNQRPMGGNNYGPQSGQSYSQQGEQATKQYLQDKKNAINNMITSMEQGPKNF